MKKAAIFLMAFSAALCLVIYMLYKEDMSRMENGEPVLFSCWGYEYAPVVGDPDEEELIMEVLENTITSRGATIEITNNTGQDISFGEDYTIEKYEGGKWNNIAVIYDDNDWNDMLYIVENGVPAEFRIYWADIYGELGSGSYRIKKVYYYDYNLSEENEIYGYFKIK